MGNEENGKGSKNRKRRLSEGEKGKRKKGEVEKSEVRKNSQWEADCGASCVHRVFFISMSHGKIKRHQSTRLQYASNDQIK